MKLYVRPTQNRAELQKIVHEIERGVLGGSKLELAERFTGIAAGVLAYKDGRDKPLELLDQLQSQFQNASTDTPAIAVIAASRERLLTFPGWSILRDMEDAPSSSGNIFPVSAFPPPFCDYIASAAKHIQVDPCAIGTAILATAAGAAQRRFTVTHPSGNGHREALCLYTAIVGDSGERKSAGFNAARCLLEPWEAKQAGSYGTELADYRAQRQAVEARKQSALTTLKSPKDPGDSARDNAETKLQAAERELQAMTPPPDPNFTASGNATPEAICERLQETGGTLLILDPEPNFFSILQGAYSKKGVPANIDVLLESYDGDDLQVIRSGGRRITAKGAHISLCIYAQPDSFTRFYSDPELSGRGMVPRFLVAYMKSMGGKIREDSDVPLDTASQARCADHLAEILDAPLTDEPPSIDWQEDARAEILRYCQTLQDARRPGGSMSAPGDNSYAAKAAGACYRIAGVLHLLSEGIEASDGISTNTVKRAIALHRYFWNARTAERNRATKQTADGYKATLEALLHLTFDAPGIRASCTMSELWRECRCHHRAIFGTETADRERFYNETVPELYAMGYLDTVQRATGKTVDVYLNPACIDLEDE